MSLGSVVCSNLSSTAPFGVRRTGYGGEIGRATGSARSTAISTPPTGSPHAGEGVFEVRDGLEPVERRADAAGQGAAVPGQPCDDEAHTGPVEAVARGAQGLDALDVERTHIGQVD